MTMAYLCELAAWLKCVQMVCKNSQDVGSVTRNQELRRCSLTDMRHKTISITGLFYVYAIVAFLFTIASFFFHGEVLIELC